MTVTYTASVSNSNLWSFIRLIFRWRGSLWKSIYVELIIWCILYTIISLVYRLALNDQQQSVFEKICVYCNQYGNLLPVTFMLGYFVTLVVGRWRDILFTAVGWIDSTALLIASYVEGTSPRANLYRRTMIRLLVSTQVMGLRIVSPSVKKRFPTMDSFVDAGLLKASEAKHLTDWLFYQPTAWAMIMVEKARAEGLIKTDNGCQEIQMTMLDFRKSAMTCVLFDYWMVPICYTQVIFLCVRVFVIVMLLGRQFIDPEKYKSRFPVDAYVPFLTIIQFLFFVGWSKVAEAILNPFGDDDDDYEANFMIDRNLQLGMSIVENIDIRPTLCKDNFWEDLNAEPLYSLQTASERQHPYMGSSACLEIDARRESRRGHRPVTMVRRISTKDHIEEFDPRAAQQRRLSVTQEDAAKDRADAERLLRLAMQQRTRKSSFGSAVRGGAKVAPMPSGTVDGTKASSPAPKDFAPESATLSTLDASALKHLPQRLGHVRWREGDDEGKLAKKSIEDVKLALRKCSTVLDENGARISLADVPEVDDEGAGTNVTVEAQGTTQNHPSNIIAPGEDQQDRTESNGPSTNQKTATDKDQHED